MFVLFFEKKHMLVVCVDSNMLEGFRNRFLRWKVPYTYNVVADPAPCVGLSAPTAI